ncbi:hypothetical protein [Streptomyces sp. NPDC054842]
MHADLSPLIAATTQWLTRAYPAGGGALDTALGEVQARQAVTVAAWLRYPTLMDAALVGVAGPGGSGRLDGVAGNETAAYDTGDDGDGADAHAWRTWVDEVVASWAASLLRDPGLAELAVEALTGVEHLGGTPVEFRRLVAPDERDVRAAPLLRHPDLLAPVADLHRAGLFDRLRPGRAVTSS